MPADCSRFSKGTTRRRVNADGDLLIEVLVAMLVATLFATAIMQMYVQTFEISNRSQDQIMAASIAQECIDALRALPYQTVASNLGTHYPIVCGVPIADALLPRPLLQDTSTYTYSSAPNTAAENGGNNKFQVVGNQVTVNISQQSATSLLVNINLQWNDGTGMHTYNTYTILVQNGLNS